MKSVIVSSLALFALGIGLEFCLGCAGSTLPNLENIEAVIQYEALLEHCRVQGKLAESYAVYAACAKAVDRKLCADHGLRCGDGGK